MVALSIDTTTLPSARRVPARPGVDLGVVDLPDPCGWSAPRRPVRRVCSSATRVQCVVDTSERGGINGGTPARNHHGSGHEAPARFGSRRPVVPPWGAAVPGRTLLRCGVPSAPGEPGPSVVDAAGVRILGSQAHATRGHIDR